MDRQQQQLSNVTHLERSGDCGDLIGGDDDQNDREHNRGSGSGHKGSHGGRGGRRGRRGGRGKGDRFQDSAAKKDPTVDEIAPVGVCRR